MGAAECLQGRFEPADHRPERTGIGASFPFPLAPAEVG
jgi:hypothetical protein